MAASFAMATTVIGGFIASGVSFMVAATVYILMAVKVKKKGVFTIPSLTVLKDKIPFKPCVLAALEDIYISF